MPKIETYVCETCGETIDKPDTELTIITVSRPYEDSVTSFIHNECLNEAMEDNEFLEAVVLHD